jgi:hypothetical protein
VFLITSSDEATDNFYFCTFLTPDAGKYKPTIRMKGTAPSDNHCYADIDLQLATPYLINWSGIGAGGAASWTCRVNGVAQSLAYGGAQMQNLGPSSVTPRVNLGIFGLHRRSPTTRGPADFRVGEQIVAAPGCTRVENLKLEASLAAKWGIALA